MSAQRGATPVWRAPIAMALLSAVGLLSALFTDGIGNVISWIALSAPVAVTVWCVARSR